MFNKYEELLTELIKCKVNEVRDVFNSRQYDYHSINHYVENNCLLEVNTGRQTGQTTTIKNFIRKYNKLNYLLIVNKSRDTDNYDDLSRKIEIVSLGQIPNYFRGKSINPDVVFFDCPCIDKKIFSDTIRQILLSMGNVNFFQTTFVRVGM